MKLLIILMRPYKNYQERGKIMETLLTIGIYVSVAASSLWLINLAFDQILK
jgi:hypothetical protein